MIEIDVAFLNAYSVEITNHDPIFVCALSFHSAISKVNTLLDEWANSEKYSIISITYVSPCLN